MKKMMPEEILNLMENEILPNAYGYFGRREFYFFICSKRFVKNRQEAKQLLFQWQKYGLIRLVPLGFKVVERRLEVFA